MEVVLETALRRDALTLVPDGFEVRLGLPWIRSMPLSSVSAITVRVDGVILPDEDVAVLLAGREVPVDSLSGEPGWWFIQDRLVLAGRRRLRAGRHDVAVAFQLMVPYLQARPGSPLVLPFSVEARLEAGGESSPGVSRDVA